MRRWGRAIVVGAVLAGCLWAPSLHTDGVAKGRSAGVVHRAPASQAARGFGLWGPGSWCWFADPRAVRVVSPRDMTFVGWIDWQGRVTVGAYSAATGARTTHVIADLYHDDHGSPSLLVEPDKRLTVFWSAHDGSALDYRTSTRPESVRAWGPVHTLPDRLAGVYGYTYPNPVRLSGEHGRLYLFWRGASWGADFATRDSGRRWSGPTALLADPGQRPYVKVDGNGRDTIAVAFTTAHPRNALTSIYYMAYRRGWWRRADGRRIARLRAGPVAAQRADLVYNARATGVPGWVWDVALGPDGRPVIVFATFRSARDHLYWYARFDGRRWLLHRLVHGGPTISPGTIEYEYSGGLALDHGDPSTVYLSRRVRGWFEIERWHTSDGGAHWSDMTVARTPGADDVRPVLARGADAGTMSLMWLQGRYGSYTHYRTSVAFLRGGQ